MPFFLSFFLCKASSERNYHIFYQLCAARELPEMRSLKLGEPCFSLLFLILSQLHSANRLLHFDLIVLL